MYIREYSCNVYRHIKALVLPGMISSCSPHLSLSSFIPFHTFLRSWHILLSPCLFPSDFASRTVLPVDKLSVWITSLLSLLWWAAYSMGKMRFAVLQSMIPPSTVPQYRHLDSEIRKSGERCGPWRWRPKGANACENLVMIHFSCTVRKFSNLVD